MKRWQWARIGLAGLGLLLVVIAGGPLLAGAWRVLFAPLPPMLPEGVLRVGVDASYPPFAVDPGTGVPVGLDIDLARAVADQMGVELRFVNMGYDGLYDSLRASQVDVLFSALRIDPLRTRDVRYTTPYFEAGQVLVRKEGAGIEAPEDLEGRTVAVAFGTEGDEAARRWQRRLHVLTLQPYATAADALAAVGAGEADAAIVDAVSARLWLREASPADHDLGLASEPVTSDPYAAAVRQDYPRLHAAINAALQVLDEDGTLQAIISRWL